MLLLAVTKYFILLVFCGHLFILHAGFDAWFKSGSDLAECALLEQGLGLARSQKIQYQDKHEGVGVFSLCLLDSHKTNEHSKCSWVIFLDVNKLQTTIWFIDSLSQQFRGNVLDLHGGWACCSKYRPAQTMYQSIYHFQGPISRLTMMAWHGK